MNARQNVNVLPLVPLPRNGCHRARPNMHGEYHPVSKRQEPIPVYGILYGEHNLEGLTRQ
jgi:hypothetical protein